MSLSLHSAGPCAHRSRGRLQTTADFRGVHGTSAHEFREGDLDASGETAPYVSVLERDARTRWQRKREPASCTLYLYFSTKRQGTRVIFP